MTIEQLFSDLIQRIPRKLTAVVICIYAILDTAMKTPGINWNYVLISVTFIAVAGIASHTLLELKNPTKNGKPELE
jgi:hypothetical protein